MASDQALEPINVATSGIERVHFQRFCIRLLGATLCRFFFERFLVA
jgi:hypothetical protein